MSEQTNLPDTPELDKKAAQEQAPPAKAAAEEPAPATVSGPSPAPKGEKEAFENNIWKPFLRPMITLMAICFAVALLLGVTNNVTAPLIAENERVAAEAARRAVLPAADEFTEQPVGEEYERIVSFYAADNGAGHVVQALAKGYGGNINVMVGFDPAGTVAGVHVLETSETPGLGKNVEKAAFTAQFAGGQTRYALAATPGDGGIEKVASATISSGAVISAVNAAMDFYAEQVQGQAALTPEEIRANLLPGATEIAPIALATPIEDIQEAWRGNDGNYIIYATAYGYYQPEAGGQTVPPIVAAVAMTPEGVILGLWLDTSHETEGLGGEVGQNQEFLAQFPGLSEVAMVPFGEATGGGVVAGVASATHTSQGVADAVNKALAALPMVKEAQ